MKKQGEHHQELEILYEFFQGLNMNGTSEFRQENVGIKKIWFNEGESIFFSGEIL